MKKSKGLEWTTKRASKGDLEELKLKHKGVAVSTPSLVSIMRNDDDTDNLVLLDIEPEEISKMSKMLHDITNEGGTCPTRTIEALDGYVKMVFPDVSDEMVSKIVSVIVFFMTISSLVTDINSIITRAKLDAEDVFEETETVNDLAI